ncbi:hypothetical protein HanPI659440_Chr10g0369601 [Helianthus annuus]|nr:hypothetical protein HanPI659440_Chr10g0369601 [Helianthus annuus]
MLTTRSILLKNLLRLRIGKGTRPAGAVSSSSKFVGMPNMVLNTPGSVRTG